MRKRCLFSFFHLFFLCVGLCLCRGEGFFVVKQNCSMPLFSIEDFQHLPYYAGEHGTSCLKLINVLLPGTFLEFISKNEKGVCKVSWHVNNKKRYDGYVHEWCLDRWCQKVSEDDVRWLPSPMSLEEAGKFFEKCPGKIPYCWGGACEKEIFLPKDTYVFEQMQERSDGGINVKKPYKLHGFDCSGLLHRISGGLLEHSTQRLREQGKILWCIGKEDDVSSEDFQQTLEKQLDELRDTDYIVIIGHVVVWWNGGIIEFRGVDYGCVFTQERDAIITRINELIERSRARKEEDSDVRFIRWHPELLKEEFKTYFPQEE